MASCYVYETFEVQAIFISVNTCLYYTELGRENCKIMIFCPLMQFTPAPSEFSEGRHYTISIVGAIRSTGTAMAQLHVV